jgi:hypothetical protein
MGNFHGAKRFVQPESADLRIEALQGAGRRPSRRAGVLEGAFDRTLPL